MDREYRVCARCVMDTSDPKIEFGKDGVCNHCRNYDKWVKRYVFTGKEGERKLQAIVDKVKKQGRNKKYDCVIGVSGGVDSTYNAYIVKKLGLRPVAVHLDNGWDTKVAAGNIERALKKLGIDLHTYVIDWEEFRDLQLAYLKASVLDVEVPTDHAIASILYETAIKEKVRYIMSGENVVTEGLLPQSWFYSKNDLANLRDIHRKFGSVNLKTFPTLGMLKLAYYRYVKRIEHVRLLDYVPYIKKDVKAFIKEELGWKDYGAKHWESEFTRFFQAYILPRRFGIDKRRAHLSALICAGQLTREEAMNELARGPYTEEELKRDKEYVLEKLVLTDEEFEQLMNLPIRSHLDYANDIKWQKLLAFIFSPLDFVNRILK